METQWRPGTQAAWFAVRVRTARDEMAERSLDRLGLEVFQPLVRPVKPPASRRRPPPRPLFTGYVFARFSPEELLEQVRYAPGVAYVVSSGKTPLPIEDAVIGEIQARLDADGLFRLHAERLEPGQRVVLEKGPFAGLVGEVEREWDDGRRVAILLEAMHRARVLVERGAVTVA